MSLLFNMLSRLVITFLPRSKCLLISWLQSPSAVILEKTLESPLDCKEIQPVHPKGDLSWMIIGRTDLKLELHYFGHLIWRVDSLEKTQHQEKKGTTEDEMAGWHHWLNAHEFGWTPGVDDGQGALECCDSWGLKELDTTERLNWIELD